MPPLHALITGGSRGIGLATARLFASNGYRCTLLSRSEDALKTAVASLAPLKPPNENLSQEAVMEGADAPAHYSHRYIVGSVGTSFSFWSTNAKNKSRKKEWEKEGEEDITPTFGNHLPKPPKNNTSHPSTIDVLVNCAGISQTSLFTTTPNETIEEVLNTNLTGLMLSTRFLLRQGYIRRRPSGKPNPQSASNSEDPGPAIINVSSLLGLKGGYGAVAYAAAKAGVLGFTRALATEYASHGVRVNAVVPGYVETGMTGGLNQTELEKQIPLARFGTPDEVAHAVLFLAQNAYAHNCVVNLDGGLSAV